MARWVYKEVAQKNRDNEASINSRQTEYDSINVGKYHIFEQYFKNTRVDLTAPVYTSRADQISTRLLYISYPARQKTVHIAKSSRKQCSRSRTSTVLARFACETLLIIKQLSRQVLQLHQSAADATHNDRWQLGKAGTEISCVFETPTGRHSVNCKYCQVGKRGGAEGCVPYSQGIQKVQLDLCQKLGSPFTTPPKGNNQGSPRTL
ncbi:hypothetical protein LTR67_008988 [Exophiala xenobiotica]